MGVGLDMIGLSPRATALSTNWRDSRKMTRSSKPQVGAVRWSPRSGGAGHVGLVIAVAGTICTTIEGNSSDSVQYKTRKSIENAVVYVMPDYDGYGQVPETVISVARAQVGYVEGTGNYTPYGKWSGANGDAWCGSFLGWCFDAAYPGGTADFKSYGTGIGLGPEGSGGWDQEGSYSGPAPEVGLDGVEYRGAIWGNSSLVTYYSRLSNGNYYNRTNRASHVTVHNAFKDCDIDTLATMVSSSGKAYNYGIDNAGVIGLFVDEQLCTDACDNLEADQYGINIVCSGTSGDGFNDATRKALCDLLEDVFRRNFLYTVSFNGNEDDTLTMHSAYNKNVDCPGSKAKKQLRSIADEVNRRLSAVVKTNFVQVGSQIAESRTLSLRNQSLINVKQIRPYVITVDVDKVDPDELDTKILSLAGVISVFFDIGSYSEEDSYHNEKLYKLCDAITQTVISMPYGFIVTSKAEDVASLRKEAYYLRFVISKRPPKFGVWLNPDFQCRASEMPQLVEEWYAFFVDWGFKSKCGLYCNKRQIKNIKWPRQCQYMPLWLYGSMDKNICPDDELLTPTFFELDDLTNYGIDADGRSNGAYSGGGGSTGRSGSGSSNRNNDTYGGSLEVTYEGDAKVVNVPSVSHPVVKKFENYTAITNKSTMNYKVTHSTKTTTDSLGFRRIDNRYLIAVGSGVCISCGTYIDVILANGTVIPCVMGDGKADQHTDSLNIFTCVNANWCCSEFIVDPAVSAAWKTSGDASNAYPSWNSLVVKFKVYAKRLAAIG